MTSIISWFTLSSRAVDHVYSKRCHRRTGFDWNLLDGKRSDRAWLPCTTSGLPFRTDELLARLRVTLRHAQLSPDLPLFTSGALQVDLMRHLAMVRSEVVKLTPTEYALLRLMIQHAGRMLTHRQILKEVWGLAYIDETHYLRVYFAQLRQKVEANPTLPQLLITEPGGGYRLVVQG